MNNERKTPRTDEEETEVSGWYGCKAVTSRLARTLERELEEARERLKLFESEGIGDWTMDRLADLYYEQEGAGLIDFVVNHMLSLFNDMLGKHGWEGYESDGSLEEALAYEVCSLLRKAGVLNDDDNSIEHVNLRQSLSIAEKERDEARADCVVKDGALKTAENCDHTYTQEALDLIRKALTLDCGNAILERLRKAEEENKARRFQFENKCLQWIEAKKESASLRIKVNDLQESIKGCEYRMMRAESATGGLRVAKLEAEAHCKRLSTERNAALSRCRELEARIQSVVTMPAEQMRLQWGEMTSQECRTVRAVANMLLSSPPQPERKPRTVPVEDKLIAIPNDQPTLEKYVEQIERAVAGGIGGRVE